MKELKTIVLFISTTIFNSVVLYKLMISDLSINYVLGIMLIFIFLSILLAMLVSEK